MSSILPVPLVTNEPPVILKLSVALEPTNLISPPPALIFELIKSIASLQAELFLAAKLGTAIVEVAPPYGVQIVELEPPPIYTPPPLVLMLLPERNVIPPSLPPYPAHNTTFNLPLVDVMLGPPMLLVLPNSIFRCA